MNALLFALKGLFVFVFEAVNEKPVDGVEKVKACGAATPNSEACGLLLSWFDWLPEAEKSPLVCWPADTSLVAD